MSNENDADYDEEDEIDEEQVADYCAMLDNLGEFPVSPSGSAFRV
jgi:hypothetical protein